jgi:uncharacterized membrane protein HdeD (DUF308 family)
MNCSVNLNYPSDFLVNRILRVSTGTFSLLVGILGIVMYIHLKRDAKRRSLMFHGIDSCIFYFFITNYLYTFFATMSGVISYASCGFTMEVCCKIIATLNIFFVIWYVL